MSELAACLCVPRGLESLKGCISLMSELCLWHSLAHSPSLCVCVHVYFLPAPLLLPHPVSRELSWAAWTAPVRQMEMEPGLCGDSCIPGSPLWSCTC